MKKASLFILLVLFFNIPGVAQKDLSFNGKKIKEGAIYFTFDGKELEYFTFGENADSRKKVSEMMTFSLLEDNSSNLYFKWINPLKYKLSWIDTTYIDDRDKVINDFVTLLAGQFGNPITTLNITESKNLIQKTKPAMLSSGSTSLVVPGGFNYPELTLLYLQLRTNQDKLTESERIRINEITKSIVDLDSKISKNVTSEVDGIFKDLFDLNAPSNVASMVEKKQIIIDNYNIEFTAIQDLQNTISKVMPDLKLNDPLLNSYSKTIFSKFLDHSNTILNSNRALTSKIKPVLEILRNSITDESSNPLTKGYYKIRNVGFEDGKKLKTSLLITEFEYKNEPKEFTKKSEIFKKSIMFQKYDSFDIFVSAGLFYSRTKFNTIGVSTNENGQLIVSEEVFSSDNPVTALFLNYSYGVGSRFFAPLVQIGIDPTKKRPFLLFGGGFTIPNAHIAFTAGPIMAWEQNLNKLVNKQVIASTNELEKDIVFKFESELKGWYFGIQYNF